MTATRDTRRGALATGGAFLFWGLAPLYWRLLAAVSSTELLAHRIAWSAPCLLALLALDARFPEVRRAVSRPRTLAILLATTVLIAANWLTFLWAVNNGHLLDASLGYYVNPLVSVLLGFAFLGERLRRLQAAAVGLAAAGVLLVTARQGLPWVSLVLAFSFGFYGLLRKVVDARPMIGLSVEIALLCPLAVGYLLALRSTGRGAFASGDAGTTLLLAAAGPITVFPLLWFNRGVRSLSLATVGMLQYLAPTGHFLLGVTVFAEPFGASELAAFSIIWTALALYTLDLRKALARRDGKRGARSG